MKNLYKVVENQEKYFDLLLNREMVRKTVKKEAVLIVLTQNQNCRNFL